MSNIEEYTQNFAFKIPNFNVATWHDEIKYNFVAIDALLSNFVASVGFKGEWKKATEYFINDTVFISDKTSEHYGTLFVVMEHHTTTNDNFDTYLAAHPTYYKIFGIEAAYDAAQLAQDWASKITGIVRYQSQDLDFSSRAYAVGGVGTETNNAKYFKEQASTYATNSYNSSVTASGHATTAGQYKDIAGQKADLATQKATDASTYATNASTSATSAQESLQAAQQIAQELQNKYNFVSILDFKWSDHAINNQSWLRSDNFTWISGTVYIQAYQHLVSDIQGKSLQSETIAGYTVQYYLADDGHKIVPDTYISAVEGIYSATGVAWYYVIDLVNQQFKLPRTTFGFNGYRIAAGKYIPEELPQHYHMVASSGSANTTISTTNSISQNSNGHSDNNDYTLQSNSGTPTLGKTSTAYSGSIVQERATEMYLYFYVGQFTQTATEQTAGLNAELFNSKADVSALNSKIQLVSAAPVIYTSGVLYLVPESD